MKVPQKEYQQLQPIEFSELQLFCGAVSVNFSKLKKELQRTDYCNFAGSALHVIYIYV
jgi:hypothetical protein